MLANILEGQAKFKIGHRQLILMTPTGRQKGYNRGDAVLRRDGDRLLVLGLVETLNHGTARTRSNWTRLQAPLATSWSDFAQMLMQREPARWTDWWGTTFFARLELDEETERRLMVWFDEQNERGA